MSKSPFRVRLLDKDLDRSDFASNSEVLNRYLTQQVSQDVRRRITACFVALTPNNRIAGYYTLASTSLLLGDLPVSISKKLPRYPSVPAVRMGRLAVDKDFEGQGLGSALLADALYRASNSEIAAYALVVDAKDIAAVGFYRHHGFIALPDSARTLFLPLQTVAKLVTQADFLRAVAATNWEEEASAEARVWDEADLSSSLDPWALKP
ncbi:MAG: GNAT family N-acetyltransferase [Propionibacteriaceae bacterium]|nr:GNAT family N-acetyltransferase [Propionibacteriaceae bacterium]